MYYSTDKEAQDAYRVHSPKQKPYILEQIFELISVFRNKFGSWTIKKIIEKVPPLSFHITPGTLRKRLKNLEEAEIIVCSKTNRKYLHDYNTGKKHYNVTDGSNALETSMTALLKDIIQYTEIAEVFFAVFEKKYKTEKSNLDMSNEETLLSSLMNFIGKKPIYRESFYKTVIHNLETQRLFDITKKYHKIIWERVPSEYSWPEDLRPDITQQKHKDGRIGLSNLVEELKQDQYN